MVSLEFEKPSTWSIGKKIGLIAVILLIVGPFLPYYVYNIYNGGEHAVELSYFDFDINRLWMFLPHISAILMAVLLYLKFDICIKKGSKIVNIKPFILMAWGFWFFLTYLVDATRLEDHAGYGLWMIVVGLFLCAVVGFLEWRYPSAVGAGVPLGRLGKKKEKEVVAEVSAEPAPEIATTADIKKPVPELVVESEPSKEEPAVEPEPIPVSAPAKAEKIEAVGREPTSEEEKTLLRWARHIAEDGKTFEQCMKCEKYVFLSAKDSGDTIVFKCPECGESFTLNK
ncbi:MAG: hypothetical protein JSV96_00145 [Candidatus Aminicenantes bacterium]|nr:MAG: hypothetical protein JSV96_00145 [Candidatus Aminicenantes bacterium]